MNLSNRIVAIAKLEVSCSSAVGVYTYVDLIYDTMINIHLMHIYE